MEYTVNRLSYPVQVTGIANVHFFEFDEHFFTPFDKHPFFELVFVSSGALHVSGESFDGVLSENSLIIHKENERHRLKALGSAPSVIIIGFTAAGIDLSEFSERPVLLGEKEIRKLAEIVKEGRNLFLPPHDVPVYTMKKNDTPLFGAEQMLRNLMEYFLITLKREFSPKSPRETAAGGFSVKEVLLYLDTKYREHITLSELAFLFGTNRTTLCKEFRLATGKTVFGYLAERRLFAAKELISKTNDTFTHIAAALNFESIHYFTRFFKKHTGMTPREYRLLAEEKARTD